jgi:hypothetical protein
VDINKAYVMCGETPIDLRMGVPVHIVDFVGLSITLIETQLKVVINVTYHSGQDARKLEDWLDVQPQRFVMLYISHYSYNAVIWVTCIPLLMTFE